MEERAMKTVIKHLEEPVYNPVQDADDVWLNIELLVEMTNEFIDYRNQVFDGACIRSTMKIEDKEDKDFVKHMDKRIKRVKKFLYRE
jgi:hypothetical protein